MLIVLIPFVALALKEKFQVAIKDVQEKMDAELEAVFRDEHSHLLSTNNLQLF